MAYKNGRPKGICVKCEKRISYTFAGLCGPCITLTRAEGTYEQFALCPHPLDEQRKRRAATVATYNRLMRQGFSFREVAQRMDMSVDTLSNYLLRCRRDYGLKAVDGRKPDQHHGQPKYGIYKCRCDPCKAIRCKTRREQYSAKAKQMPS